MTKRNRRIAVCTGARSEYGILRPIMRRLSATAKIELSTIAAGMHLSPRFGRTITELSADGFEAAGQVPMLAKDDSPAAMAEAVGRGITGFTRVFRKIDPDIVVVLGDRVEAFAAAVAATLSGKILAHIHGGDRAEAGFDDFMRHAITKLAHIHFAATKESAERIRKLGERKDRIFITGAPGLDEIRTTRLPAAAATKRKYGFDAKSPLVLCIEHSVSTHPETAAREMGETLWALARLALPTILVYPNSDAGGRAIIDVIKSYEGAQSRRKASTQARDADGAKWLVTAKSLPRAEYLAVMKAASVMVGNSSSGIIEAASFGLPVVNIGRRQAGRQRSGNTIDVPPARGRIISAIVEVLSEPKLRGRLAGAKNVYGDGRASGRIAKVLSRIKIDGGLRRKQLTY